MTRKLHRFTLALSATAMALAMLLLAARPQVAGSDLSAEDVNLDAAVAPIATVMPADQATASQRRHRRRSRAVLALPYFSFAQGLRRVTGS